MYRSLTDLREPYRCASFQQPTPALASLHASSCSPASIVDLTRNKAGVVCARRIPTPYLANTKKFLAPELPEVPLIVFINSKSGGHAGAKLTEVLYHTLGHAQVLPHRLRLLKLSPTGQTARIMGLLRLLTQEVVYAVSISRAHWC